MKEGKHLKNDRITILCLFSKEIENELLHYLLLLLSICLSLA